MAKTAKPSSNTRATSFEVSGQAPGAFVHPSARLEDGVIIDPGAVIGPRAAIGGGTLIGATAVIGPDVQIGRDCLIGAGAAITHALIGDNVTIHAGCRIGQQGSPAQARDQTRPAKSGRVIVQDHVEIGAGTTVDCGNAGDTVIGEGTGIGNLVQISPDAMVGRHCRIVAQCGIASGARLEDHVTLGRQASVADNLTVGEGALIGANVGVAANVPAGEER